MPRSRLITVVVMATALLAALVFGAAAVLGWALARPIGVVSGLAALTNIGLISSPRSAVGRRLALVFGAAMLVASVAVGAWGFIAGSPWWLATMPIVGALLMIPEVLDLITFPDTSRAEEGAVDDDEVEPLPDLAIEMDEEEDHEAAHAFFSGAERSSSSSAGRSSAGATAVLPTPASDAEGAPSAPTPVSPTRWVVSPTRSRDEGSAERASESVRTGDEVTAEDAATDAVSATSPRRSDADSPVVDDKPVVGDSSAESEPTTDEAGAEPSVAPFREAGTLGSDSGEPVTRESVTQEPVTTEPTTQGPVTRRTDDQGIRESFARKPLAPESATPESATDDREIGKSVTQEPLTPQSVTPESATDDRGSREPAVAASDTRATETEPERAELIMEAASEQPARPAAAAPSVPDGLFRDDPEGVIAPASSEDDFAEVVSTATRGLPVTWDDEDDDDFDDVLDTAIRGLPPVPALDDADESEVTGRHGVVADDQLDESWRPGRRAR